MDLLLTHGYFLADDAKEQRIMKPYVPLGILYLSSHLRRQGMAVEVFDSTFSTFDELESVLEAGPPAVLGIYANLMTRRNAVRILQAAKRSGWVTVAGGPEPGAYAAEYLAAGADVVVYGEGELTLEELVPVLRERQRCARDSGRGLDLTGCEGIRGLAFLQADGRVCQTAPRPLIADLDAQPWPDRERVPVERYLAAWRQHHGTGSVALITARGCPYRCRWCSHAVYGRTHRRRDPDRVVEELEWVLGRYAPDMLWIADDVFTIHHAWLERYAAAMRERRLHIPFECISRADRLNPAVLDRLAELGCFRLWIGSESGSQRLLDAMQRDVKVEQVQAAADMARARGIQVGMFLMWGYADEEMADIEATVAHVKRADPDIFLTTVSYPIKGTPYFAELENSLTASAPWTETSDRELRIRGRHSRRFYSYADQLLEAEVQLHRRQRAGAAEPDLNAFRTAVQSARSGLLGAAAEVEA
ncbi:MAG: B12-binding domain-containing radical SAM protein [Terriglobales bacterium]